MPNYSIMKTVESYLYENKKQIEKNDELKIDFSLVEYIEIGCLFYIISLITISIKRNIIVKIKLPNSIAVRNIFRIWRFPIVIKELTGITFKELVEVDDLKYFGESKELQGDFYKRLAQNEDGLIKLFELNFFSLYNLPFDTDQNKKNTLINESKRWEDTFIKAVLMKHLKQYDKTNENLIPRIIIYECLTNAYRHPNSDFLLAGSFYDRKGNLFTINYWDNGASIFMTLKDAIYQNRNIKAKFDEIRFEDLYSTFYVKLVNGKETNTSIKNSNQLPDKTFSDHDLLLSSFFPGVSRDPDGNSNYFVNKEIDVNSPGMGLTYLLKVVVNKLGGMLSVRTKDYFINFSKPTNNILSEIEDYEMNGNKVFKNKYKCKIESFQDSDCYFKGNMVTIRLPLN